MSAAVCDAFEIDGAALIPAVLSPDEIETLRLALEDDLTGRPGRRLRSAGSLIGLLGSAGKIGELASGLLGAKAFPVRAVAFDKSPASNWIVAWHQDRTICVTERIGTDGFGPWSTKDSILHVTPQVAVLEGMATLRIHLDPVDADNGPLLAAKGSHRLGLVPADAAAELAARHEVVTCFAETGDVWAYSTPILHASERSRSGGRRRVLQVDYATQALPGGLTWAGLG